MINLNNRTEEISPMNLENTFVNRSLFDGAIDETDGIDVCPSETYNAQNISAKYDSLTL